MNEGQEARKPNIILTPDNRLHVFISSTLKELAEEREAVRQSVLKLRLLPVMFEAGARPHPAQELYQAYLSQSQVFIGIYWQSYGWVGPGMEISGLEDEFNLSSHLPRLIYVKSPAPNREAGLQKMLARLQAENSASYKHFSSTAELGDLVENDLALLLSESYEAASRNPSTEFEPRPLTNIPFPRNALLGRAQELETLCAWLSDDQTALVTLTGTGGAGKSRLALEAALELRNRFRDGVYLVRLTPVSDPARVLPAIAETLGLYESAQSRPVEDILQHYLRDRQVLLLLDNFEQILDAAPQIAYLLEACPHVKALVTSRSPLRVRGEHELPVPPLPVPNPKQSSDSEQLSQYASVALFIQRAQGVRPDFRVTGANAPAIAEICYQLDGLPLAIELAAARIRLLSPQELLARLGRRFEILRGGTRDLPERQQTLRGAIDWSYNLLAEPARAVFRRLSVFKGGFSLEAAEAICNLEAGSQTTALEQVEALVDSSLLMPTQGPEGQQRFGMLESIHEYAYERLMESGEAAQVHRLHAEYFLHLAEALEPRIRSAERGRATKLLEQDLDNLRTVLEWTCTDAEGRESGERLMRTLALFWSLCGHLSEGQQYCQAFMAQMDEDTPPSLRAGLIITSSNIALLKDGTKAAAPNWVEAIRLARQSGEKALLGLALLLGGAWSLASNNAAEAEQYLDECCRLSHDSGDEWTEVLAMVWLGNAFALLGNQQRAQELATQAIALGRHQGDPWLLVVPLIDVAQTAFMQGDLDKAEATLLEVESMVRTVGDQWTLAWPLCMLAQLHLMRRDVEVAGRYLRETLQASREYGNMMAQIFGLVETACALALRYGPEGTEPEQRKSELMNAARLCGATQHFKDYPILLGSISTRQIYDNMVMLVRSGIEPEIWDAGFQEGSSMQFEQALDIAAAELKRLADQTSR